MQSISKYWPLIIAKEKINLEGGKAVTQHHGNTIDTVRNNKYFWCFLLLAIPLAFYMRFVFFSVFGSDDLAYAKNAFDMANGNFKIQAHPFANRIGLILPVAVLYKLFGVNEYTSIVYPFLCSIAHSILTFVSGILFFNFRVGIFAMLLMLFLPLDIVNATLLMPDLPASTFISICSIIFLYCERSTTKRKDILYFLAGISLGWAYLIKETSVFFFVFLIIYMTFSVIKKKPKFGWIYLGIGILLPVIIEAIYYFWKTGDVFFRVHGIETSENTSPFSGINYHDHTLLKRLFYDLIYEILENRMHSFYFFFVFACIILVLREKKRQSEIWYFILWFCLTLLNLNFCPTTVKVYNLLIPLSRYMYPLIFPCVMIFAYYLDRLYQVRLNSLLHLPVKNIVISLIIPLGIICILNIIKPSFSGVFFIIIIFLIICFLFSTFARSNKYLIYIGSGITSLFILINILPSIYITIRYINKDIYNTMGNVRYILDFTMKSPNKLIYADSRMKNIIEYANKFKNNVRIESIFNKNTNEIVNSYIIIDKDYLLMLEKDYHMEIPRYLKNHPLNWKMLKRFNTTEDYGCFIYEVGDKIF